MALIFISILMAGVVILVLCSIALLIIKKIENSKYSVTYFTNDEPITDYEFRACSKKRAIKKAYKHVEESFLLGILHDSIDIKDHSDSLIKVLEEYKGENKE